MAKFRFGDVVKVKYKWTDWTNSKTERKDILLKVHRVIEGAKMVSEVGMLLKDAYIWKTHDGTFEWDSIREVDTEVNGKYTLVNTKAEEQKYQISDYPDVCSRCGAPAYVGLNEVECSSCGKH